MAVYKEYTVCTGEHIHESLYNDWRQIYNLTSAYPSWFVPVLNPYTGYFEGYSFTTPSTTGVFVLGFNKYFAGVLTEYTIVINVNTEAGCVLSEYDNCCVNQCNIAWLNRQGGWQNYIFTGIKEFSVDVGGAKDFINSDLQKKWSEVERVYNGKVCSTGDIPKSHVDLLDSLRYSIQAFLYNDETLIWDIPIFIDKRSFQKYNSRQKFFDIKIRFIYAEELVVQTQ